MASCKFYLALLIFCFSSINGLYAQSANVLTKSEQQNGWHLLFDGKTFNGWKNLAGSGGWEIKDGEIMALPFTDHKQRDIITNDLFGNFELVVEFKISKATNSGIKYLVTSTYPGYEGNFLGLEYQILDEENFKYPERGVLRSMASLYDLIPANKKNVVLKKWNIAKIIVNENHIEHWLNGIKVVEYDRSSKDFKTLVEDSKYKNMENFGRAVKGHILLQNEGTPMSFRSIKIKPLLTNAKK